jgi:hypothetical protein
MKKLIALFSITAAIIVTSAQAQALLEWNFSGDNSSNRPTMSSTFNAAGSGSAVLSRGVGAPATAGGDSFRTTGFQNNGISLLNDDYFEFTLSITQVTPIVSLSSIDMRFAGTAAYSAAPGVDMAWAYSFDGGAFTLLNTFNRIGNGTSSFDLSGVSALQSVTDVQAITFRFFASGQTTTGGWGFINSAAQDPGLVLNGTIDVVPEPSTYALLALSGGALALYRFRTKRRQS